MSHLSGELFKRSMAIDAVSVPYKGNAPAMSDLISGRLDFYFATERHAAQHQVRSAHCARVNRQRARPFVARGANDAGVGIQGLHARDSWGYLVPRGTPAAVTRQLQDAIAKSVRTPAMQERLTDVGASSRDFGGPDVMTAKMKDEIARWGPVIKEAHIKPELPRRAFRPLERIHCPGPSAPVACRGTTERCRVPWRRASYCRGTWSSPGESSALRPDPRHY